MLAIRKFKYFLLDASIISIPPNEELEQTISIMWKK